MSQNVINEHTDENIKNYLFDEEKNRRKNEEIRIIDNDRKDFIKKYKSAKRKKLIFVGLFLVLAIASLAVYMFYAREQKFFDENEIRTEVEVSGEIFSGEETTFVLKYENNTNVELKNVMLSLSIPESFIFISSDKELKEKSSVLGWEIEKISPKESGKIKIFGKIVGEKNSEHSFVSRISYMPSNFNSEFQSSSDIKVKIDLVPFELEIVVPNVVTSGDEMEYAIDYKNISNRNFDSVKIIAEFPDGFEYNFLEPEISSRENGHIIWEVKNLVSNGEGKIIAKGIIEGNDGEEKEIKVDIEVLDSGEKWIKYITRSSIVKIQEAPIVLSQLINNEENCSVDKGEEIEYKIKFKNISNREIRGLVINSVVEGNVDFDSLSVANGSYDDKYKITWSAFNVPKLASLGPREEDEVSFKIKVKDYIEVETSENKNFVITNRVSISSFNFDSDSTTIGKVIASSESETKLNSSLFIRAMGYFNDDGRILNSGMIPPEVGEKTTYTVHWNLGNLFNDVENLRIFSILPEGVKWTGNYIDSNGTVFLGDESNGSFTPEEETVDEEIVEDNENIPENPINEEETKDENGLNNEEEKPEIEQILEEKFYYNTKTREVIWEMPQIEANAGTFSPAKEVVFQVSIVPENSDVGDVVKIMGEIKAVGYDKFTGEEIVTFESELTTELPDDDSIGVEEGIVIPSSKIELE